MCCTPAAPNSPRVRDKHRQCTTSGRPMPPTTPKLQDLNLDIAIVNISLDSIRFMKGRTFVHLSLQKPGHPDETFLSLPRFSVQCQRTNPEFPVAGTSDEQLPCSPLSRGRRSWAFGRACRSRPPVRPGVQDFERNLGTSRRSWEARGGT